MIVVWFSCGVASAVAAKVTLEKYPDQTVRIVNIPVAEEDSDNIRFKDDVAKWLGVEIETYIHAKWPKSSAVEIWEHGRFMSNRYGAEYVCELLGIEVVPKPEESPTKSEAKDDNYVFR